MNRILISLFCSALLSASVLAENLPEREPQRGYTTSTLQKPIFDLAQVAVEVAAINNWLNANYEKLSYEQMKGPREHLYYLIDSYIKDLYAKEKRIIPVGNDLVLERLFFWSERLGVYGGSHIYNVVKSSESSHMPELMEVPEQISLGLDGDLLTLSAEAEGWSVKIPYYFMIWNINDFTATNGKRTQLVALSTGAAADKSEAGKSQATIMLMFSPEMGIEEFSEYWRQGVGIDSKAVEKEINIDNRKSLYVYDAAAKLHKEMAAWISPQGSFAVAYLGMDGTYQWNRPHFLDFLQALEIDVESSHNKAPKPTQ